jgi:hypothetical protein
MTDYPPPQGYVEAGPPPQVYAEAMPAQPGFVEPPNNYQEPFKWTGSGGLSDTQSYAFIIHNAIFDRLSTSTFFQGFAVKRISEALPIEAGFQIPFLGVYEGEETLGPEGQFNAGEIRFTHTVNFGVQVVVKDNDPVACLTKLDQAYWFIMNRLWRDDTFTNRLFTTLPDNTRFEGVQRIKKRKRWGATGSKNETPVGILQLDIAIVFKTDFYPTEFPDLERITVTTAYPEGGTPEEIAAVQQVKIVYEFTPDSVPTPLPPDP